MATDLHGVMSAHSPSPALPPQDVVRVVGLTRSFGGRAVIDGLDLTLRAGEFTAVLGRGGSGKSTLLRVLAGLDREIRGTVLVPKGRVLLRPAPRPAPWKRLWRKLLVPPSGDHPGPGFVEVVGEDCAPLRRSRAWPRALSGGGARRVPVARVPARRPDLLLLDDPFGDIAASWPVAELRRRHRGCTVLLVTGDVDQALLFADRALVLRDGVITYGTPVAADSPRLPGTPEFAALRARLLAELGPEADV
ncbi:ATP-binding cassette domain-containing protein [Streptomyces sp. RTGN2]|uniref:ATP-binding cassette domain-containing protein n=1 Tax=Streptomyces sp. RTGN2 TaxID=3016525 RepID=UPI0025546D74|nr:ATP-binding cassette domain-containing protein [Streptomyces sp. RTGN2]